MKSIWPDWPTIRQRTQRADRVVFFLDYDGTLAPIASHPAKARIPAQTKRLLQKLSRNPKAWVCIVSGRGVKDVRRMVGISSICYVGNHGLEIRGPKFAHVNPAAAKSRPVLREIARRLKSNLKQVPGAWLEDKGLTLTVHFRNLDPRGKLDVRNIFHQVVRPYHEKGQVRMTAGKEVLEVRPPVHWTKGTVVGWLLGRQGAQAGAGKILPIYIGDDQTDEDAFKALKNKGITIAVGPANLLTQAGYLTSSPREVYRFLRQVAGVLFSEGGADGSGRSHKS